MFIVVDFYMLVTKVMSSGAHHTFFISLLTKGVSNAGSSGVEGQLLGRGGESRSFFLFSGGEDGTQCFSILNPGVQNTGGSGDSRLSEYLNNNANQKREAWKNKCIFCNISLMHKCNHTFRVTGTKCYTVKKQLFKTPNRLITFHNIKKTTLSIIYRWQHLC